ncbi:flavin-containing monooxygenase [Nocardia goodfellowii]|uniref:Cation diffusion facilitator CzcD-associated flavoprotein CzcO n=1 Tax=Nocardia goodfellowii TaxID=882446 RepID=A0ABS4Q887_9NOCA|nr:NAD(P)/FAD-dependent oxidoreductase [Nocardia goodfellowii]MBP2187906.1 cation diffusion facilitator CzcD-associated flavoprotein CzcO [Nocardia goodfellowii]
MTSSRSPGHSRLPRIAVIGAGMSGICMAITLQRAGFTDFTVFEKTSAIGGVWRDNTYPGLTCDLPSRIYQFSFAPNPEWSSFFSPGAEIDRYLTDVAHRHNLEPHIRFDTEVRSAEFDGTAWTVRTDDGVEIFDFVVCATGIQHNPHIAELPGMASFAGSIFHSARWDHSAELVGRRVGVVGTGSTGVQLTTALAGKAAHFSLFQRTAQWMLPVPNPRYFDIARWLRRRYPVLDRLSYRTIHFSCEFLFDAVINPGWRRTAAAWICRANLRRVRDRDLRRALTPDYVPLCKRIVVSTKFYRAVQRPDVSVVTDAIERVEPRGIVTADGTLHELDVIVLATGFDPRSYMRPMNLIGTHGRTIHEEWESGPNAFETVALPGFPNVFLMLGPNSPVGNFPLTVVAEWQAQHIVGWLQRWSNGELSTVEPTRAAAEEYNAKIRAAMPNTVWTSGCQSWYLGADGSPDLWPFTPRAHRTMMQRIPDLANYHISTPAHPARVGEIAED